MIESLAPDNGGGYLAMVPELPGGMSDSATAEAAVANVQDAIDTWIEAANDVGHAIPAPSRHLVLEAAH